MYSSNIYELSRLHRKPTASEALKASVEQVLFLIWHAHLYGEATNVETHFAQVSSCHGAHTRNGSLPWPGFETIGSRSLVKCSITELFAIPTKNKSNKNGAV